MFDMAFAHPHLNLICVCSLNSNNRRQRINLIKYKACPILLWGFTIQFVFEDEWKRC